MTATGTPNPSDTAPEAPVGWALLVNITVFSLKLVVGMLTGSSAMLTEAAHSLVDVATQTLLYRGEVRPAHRHHYGLAAAVTMFASGGVYGIVSGLRAILSGDSEPLVSPYWAAAVLVGGSILEAISATNAIRALNRTRSGSWWAHLRSTTDTASLTILCEDGADIAGNTLALVGIGLAALTGSTVFDGAASVLIGVMLTGMAGSLATRNVRALRTV